MSDMNPSRATGRRCRRRTYAASSAQPCWPRPGAHLRRDRGEPCGDRVTRVRVDHGVRTRGCAVARTSLRSRDLEPFHLGPVSVGATDCPDQYMPCLRRPYAQVARLELLLFTACADHRRAASPAMPGARRCGLAAGNLGACVQARDVVLLPEHRSPRAWSVNRLAPLRDAGSVHGSVLSERPWISQSIQRRRPLSGRPSPGQ